MLASDLYGLGRRDRGIIRMDGMGRFIMASKNHYPVLLLGLMK